MGKKRSKYDLELLRQTQAAEAEIDSIYREAIRRVTRLGYSREAPDGRLFSFDEAGAIVSKQFNAEQKRLMTSVASAIREDVRKSWKLANSKNDKMAQTVLNGRGLEITDRLKRRYFSTNDEALAAFIGRKNNGLGLSERVWKYAEQFKSEVEMAIDIGLRDGRSADALSRDVRAYLRNPEKLFRRVRDEHGQLVLSKAAKAYHPGRGVYRSSYKNARRLASTETNMAYHKADKERWAQLDFIVGFRVEPSKNHPEPDICDDLKGEYPKTFDFSGWHPHCRCHAVPIMKSDDEMMKDNAAILAGEEPSENSENTVRNVPAGFSEWVRLNGARIDAAKSLPYFIRDNRVVVDNILNPQPVRAALDVAKERHAARTPEQKQSIRRAWTLRSAEVRHNARTGEQKQAIKKAWYDRKATLHYGNRMLNVMGGISRKTKALAEALTSGNLDVVMAEAKKLKEVGKKIMTVGYFDNPLALLKEYPPDYVFVAAEFLSKYNTRDMWLGLSLSDKREVLLRDIKYLSRYEDIHWFGLDIMHNELKRIEFKLNPPLAPKTHPLSAQRHSKRTKEYYEDVHRRWALREMRVKNWGDFKASTETAAEVLEKYKGTEDEFKAMLKDVLLAYNKELPAEKRLSSECIEEVISIQARRLDKDNTIRRPGSRTQMQDYIAQYAAKYDLKMLPLSLDDDYVEHVKKRASLQHCDINRLAQAETELESIAKLAGGDETGGSCASLAQAFAARRLGYNVLDYRGGEDRKINAMNFSFGNLADVGRFRVNSSQEVFDYISDNMNIGEYYMLCSHRHQAIVKKTNDGKIFYLEMQDPDNSENTWHRIIGPASFALRFGEFKISKNFSGQLISFTDIAKNFDLFARNLETIHNTGKQWKGTTGARK